mmetsp:Transcript_36350/g.85832  ORF Transcript_36350/g.85832 Transcript_36350/m.85832 type:complete len:210 (+) Transcript_36350:1146-1775(+)
MTPPLISQALQQGLVTRCLQRSFQIPWWWPPRRRSSSYRCFCVQDCTRYEGGKYIIYVLPLRLGTLIPQSLVHCLRLTVSRTAPLSGWRQPEAHLAPATRLRAPLSQPAWPVCVPPCSAPAPRPTPLRPLPRGTLRAYSVAARHPVSPAIHRSPRTRHQAATARPSRWLRCAAVSSCFFFFSSHGRHLSSSSSMPLPSSSPSNCESWRA